MNRAPPEPPRRRARREPPPPPPPPAEERDDDGQFEMPNDDRGDDRTESDAVDENKEEKEEKDRPGTLQQWIRPNEQNKRWGPEWAHRAELAGLPADKVRKISEDPRNIEAFMSAEQLAQRRATEKSADGPDNVPYLGKDDDLRDDEGMETVRRGKIADMIARNEGRPVVTVPSYKRSDGKVVHGHKRAPQDAAETRLEVEKKAGYMRPRYGYAEYKSDRHGKSVGVHPIEGPRYSWSRFGRSKVVDGKYHYGEPEALWKKRDSHRPMRDFATVLSIQGHNPVHNGA